MIIEGKDKGIFCIINESYKNFNAELDKNCFTLSTDAIITSKIRYHKMK